MRDYIQKHPLTEMMRQQSWNNIPLPVKEVIEMMCDAMVAQDVHSWERKALQNGRFAHLQKNVKKTLNALTSTKQEVGVKLRTLFLKIEELNLKLS